MKSKAPLSLMEQLIMLLVFALAAALCLQVFVLSAQISRRCKATDHAVTAAQNAAEALKATSGDLQHCKSLLGGTVENGIWQIWYDENWTESEACAPYYMTVTELATNYPCLGSAEISTQTESGDVLFCMTVFWQEVNGE